ncbi:MAG: cytochrome [Actinomycetia bacterium]|nr:cytochrome [Actinomycetes bacterium]
MATSMAAAAPEGLKPVPGDGGLPFLGQTLSMLRDPLGLAQRRYAQYGPVSWGKVLGKRMVALYGPEAAEAVLVNRDKAFANGPAWSFFIGPFFYRGIMLMDFEEHLHHRRIMQQAFSRDRLRSYQKAMSPSITRGLDSWQPGDFKVLPNFKQLTLDLAMDVFMGVELDRAQADRINKAFIDAVRAGLSIIRYPVPGGRWRRGLRARRTLEAFFNEHLPAKRADGGDDLFAALCQAETDDGHRFSDEDIVSHMIFVLMAAHDTSTITMTTMAYYLAKHPEWQERVREESRALGKETLDFEDLDRLVSLDLVMKECLRLVAPVPGLPRETVKDTSVLGYHVPAGTMVTISPNVNHHIADYWPDPDRFDPERFSADRREDKIHQYAWEPFGGGVHKCIGLHFGGMEVKSVMHQVLLRYRWTVPAEYEWPLDMSTLPVPKDGLPVQLERI